MRDFALPYCILEVTDHQTWKIQYMFYREGKEENISEPKTNCKVLLRISFNFR